jgi:nicotinamide riboside kinase
MIAMAESLVIAVLGAESTGKTTLAQALATRIADETGLATTWVPEWLREWCEREGRTPRPDEQAAIATQQHERIAAAAATYEVVIVDTTALATAVYSGLLFDDRSLEASAVALHAQVDFTLLTALDLAWVADGHQRDGEHVREPVDRRLRELLIAHRLPWALVSGTGRARLENALDAVSPLLRQRQAPKRGLFTRLDQRDAEAPDWPWICETCDVPECEHAMKNRRLS